MSQSSGGVVKYWWVNHKQTMRQEIGGGYLWSPKEEANGSRSQFYDNMRIAAPGDPVLSYAGGSLRTTFFDAAKRHDISRRAVSA
ncbi:hypothetical protein [Bradyrhizobium sp. LTSPM299]|uniref:hypothetical protein n=1 Tax=Bradyrhizobium sp. LTSPM299 TaxID=1619233 RepID=UPI0018CE8CED|nr:hypothetical protein [Bradyrhizobium sp. LTSPM299]